MVCLQGRGFPPEGEKALCGLFSLDVNDESFVNSLCRVHYSLLHLHANEFCVIFLAPELPSLFALQKYPESHFYQFL